MLHHNMSSSPLPLDERFSKALHHSARVWRQTLDRRLKDLGMGQAGWLTIACAAASDGNASARARKQQARTERKAH